MTGVGMLWVGPKIETVAATLRRLARHRVRARGKRSARSLGMRALLATLLISAVAITVPGYGGTIAEPETKQAPQPANVFEMPAYASLQQLLTKAVITLFRDRRYADAEKALRHLVDRFPNWPVHHYNLAAALARQNKHKEALESLDTAISRGFASKMAMERDPDLDTLRELPRFRELLAKLAQRSKAMARKARPPFMPRLVQEGRAIVDGTNTAWDPRSNTLIAAFKFTKSPKIPRVYGDDDRISRLLNLWYGRGEAAGNHGDLYDNRDNGHSLLSKKLFPQLSHVEYGADARAAGVHWGVNSRFLFNAITFGNSSTAMSGRLWRSQARLVLTTPELVVRTYGHYVNDHLYVFPEHRDHDPERGDLFPANTPYMIVSQGSSGSDRPFLRAVGAILAAFRPDVKAYLRAKHLVAPTVQMIFRSGQKSVTTFQDYMSAKAHPSVFEAADIDLEKMIRRARGLRADAVPPRVQIAVVEESKAKPDIDYFGAPNAVEVLFDTPSAIARIVRSTAYERRMVISAAKTTDPNGLPLRFTWKVLRGDADKITIKPFDSDASVVELRIPWHRRRPVPFKPELTTDRVDIAVFAHNGEHYSAPAFVSLYYPPNQARRYDQAGRILEVDYAPPDLQDRYADPVLFARRVWRDLYHYTEEGQLIGWDRISGHSTRRFTRHGARVVETDASGRPTKAERIRYEIKKINPGLRQIVEVPTGKFIVYRYRAASDLLGEP